MHRFSSAACLSRYIRSLVASLLLVMSVLALSSCSTNIAPPTTSSLSTTNNTSSNAVLALNLKALQSLTTITPALSKYRVVFVGEQHDQYADHINQLSIVKGLFKYWGKNSAIGLEMIQQPFQSYLDQYIAGTISEREMLRGVEWYERWSYDFRLYRPIFAYAKANQIPLIALNIPKELTRKITKVGIRGLNAKERQYLPHRIDRSNSEYTKRITAVFGKHSRTRSKGVAKFLDAQLAWDEGMAFSAYRYLQKNPTSRMVILAGEGHVINRSGIPNRLDRQLQSTSAVVLNNVNDPLSSQQGDYLLFSPQLNLPPQGLMGILMGDNKKGVLVKAVMPHSAALKAGILKDDIIIEIDGNKIRSSSDVKLWGLDKMPNTRATIKLRRNNKVLIKNIELKSKQNTHH